MQYLSLSKIKIKIPTQKSRIKNQESKFKNQNTKIQKPKAIALQMVTEKKKSSFQKLAWFKLDAIDQPQQYKMM